VQPERRRVLRFPFEATAEVSWENSASQVPARVTEISPNGCYLQMGRPAEPGSSVFLKVFAEGSFFEAHATVIYSQPNSGMGVAFRDLKPYFVGELKKWLLTAMHAKQKPRE
jgi:PilZ domain-containing protein